MIKEEVKGKVVILSVYFLVIVVGLEMLEVGGNVVDVVVVIFFVLGVVELDVSGVGGYGEMLVYLKDMLEFICIEFLICVLEVVLLSNG